MYCIRIRHFFTQRVVHQATSSRLHFLRTSGGIG